MQLWKCVLVLMLALRISATGEEDFDPAEYEEEAGATSAFLLNPDDQIYGFTIGSGTWLKNTPVFGDYFLGLFSSGLEDSWYSTIGMTIRILPHWRWAPFVGGGGSYNYSFSDKAGTVKPGIIRDEEVDSKGDSYWGGHAEAGLRIWLDNRIGVFEVMGRYTWSSLPGDRDYWLVGISTAAGI